MNDAFDMSELIEEYREEARQQLDHVDQSLLGLEERAELDEPTRLDLLRTLHTLKGNSAMIGLREIAEQVHVLETVFKGADLRHARSNLDSLFELSATLRSAVDRLGTPEQQAALERLQAIRLDWVGRSDADNNDGPAPSQQSAVHDVADESAGRAVESVPPPPAAFPQTDPDSASAGPETAATTSEVLRVPFAKLDLLLSHVGELDSFHARLDEFLGRNRETLAGTGLRRELREWSEDLQVRSDALRDTALTLRLVPLHTVFGRFPALVRELAREEGKKARLVIEGADNELDKTAADALGEPLLHLLRNAVDHGLESPEARRAAGKDETGTIRMIARREGDQVRIDVSDDGAGVDRARILARARDAGMIGADLEPGDEDVRDLIFLPGFSTRAEATPVSGRGMGLDIVRRGILRLSGSLDIEETEGGGTTFVLRFPLTLAVVPALVFESDGELFAISISEVVETLPKGVPERAGGTEVIRHEGAIVPLATPARIFDWPRESITVDEGPRYSIVLRKGDRSAAIPASRLVDQRSMVVKALPPYLGSIPGVSGATVAPDGRVILLLDGQGVLDLNLAAHRKVTGSG